MPENRIPPTISLDRALALATPISRRTALEELLWRLTGDSIARRRDLDDAVAAARGQGMSWRAIGCATGKTGAAAYAMWAGKKPELPEQTAELEMEI